MKKKWATRADDFAQWYLDCIARANLAEHSIVKGCMIIKPLGYAIWERLQNILDGLLKSTGHKNVYFPLFIPLSFLSKEASHVAGFAQECAVVTHYRLRSDKTGVRMDESARLAGPLIVRPTSEAIMWHTYRSWIRSHRDLPLLLNQWANVVRWELRTRLFLRTSEFLWQEGHTAHASSQEAQQEALRMLDIYTRFLEDYMAIPVIRGVKTALERFAGAVDTYCIEALMQDAKALQAGTSHFLGQNFAKAFDVRYATPAGGLEYVWGTSWGVSTRLMGALIMVHGDDKGIVLPPKIAPNPIVIVPIFKTEAEKVQVLATAEQIHDTLQGAGINSVADLNENRTPGWKFAEYEAQGIPLRIAIGPRDIESNSIEVTRRDTQTKATLKLSDLLPARIQKLLDDIQSNLLNKAKAFRKNNTQTTHNYDAFKDIIAQKGGFVRAHWNGDAKIEAKIKEETQATIRCIPLDEPKQEGKCIYTGKKSPQEVIFAKSY